MSIPPATLKVFEMTRVDFAIEEFAKIEKPTRADLNKVWVQADIQCKIDEYRMSATKLSEKLLRDETHQSDKMAAYMADAGDPRPNEHCHCHAMISGGHREAATLRAVMAWCLMRIDDPRNGCWLPSNTEARKHVPSWLKNAVPHSRIHRNSYYRWLSSVISFNMIKNITDLTRTLKMVRTRLQSGCVPKNILDELRL